MKTLTTLSVDIHSMNQRMMVISQQLSKHSRQKPTMHSAYRVLGWRLDQDTNQWVADIEYQGKVSAYTTGEHVGSSVVRSVNANGVNIKP